MVDNDYWNGLFFCKTDFQGNVVWQKTIAANESSLFSSYNAISDKRGVIYITGAHVIEQYEEVNVFLSRIDPSTGDTLSFEEFTEPGVEAGYRLQWLPDSTILIFGITSVGDYSRILLMNVDTTGHIIYNKSYGTGIVRDTRFFQLDDNGSISIAFGDDDCDPSGYYFYSIDSIGNIGSIYHSDVNCLEWGVPSLTDDGYYIASYEYYIYLMTFFGKLKSDFTYQWKNYFEPNNIYALWAQFELGDGSVIVYGSKKYSGTSENYHAFIRKIDNLGNTVWEREYYTEKEFYPSYIWSIAETPSGGLICAGTGFGEPLLQTGLLSQNFWLLKLDSSGCLEAGCNNTESDDSLLNSSSSAISIYPNPLLQEGTIQINLDLIDITNISYLEIELRDIMGHIIDEFTIDQYHWSISNNKILIPLNRGMASNGIYFVQVKASDKIIGNLKVLFF